MVKYRCTLMTQLNAVVSHSEFGRIWEIFLFKFAKNLNNQLSNYFTHSTSVYHFNYLSMLNVIIKIHYSLCLNFFHLLARKPNLENFSIYSNKFFHNINLSEDCIIKWKQESFVIFTNPNPDLLVTGFEQVGYCEDCIIKW